MRSTYGKIAYAYRRTYVIGNNNVPYTYSTVAPCET